MVIHAVSINRDHDHKLEPIPPRLSVYACGTAPEGLSSNELLSKFALLRERYLGQHLLTRGLLGCEQIHVTNEAWSDCIQNERPPELEDRLEAVGSAITRTAAKRPPWLRSAIRLELALRDHLVPSPHHQDGIPEAFYLQLRAWAHSGKGSLPVPAIQFASKFPTGNFFNSGKAVT